MTFVEPLDSPAPPWESGPNPVWPDIDGQPEHELAEWLRPPPDHLGASVPLERIVYSGAHVVLMLASASAYQTGVSLDVRTVVRRGGRDLHVWQHLRDQLHAPPFFHPQREGDLRVGVQLSDGRSATADGRRYPDTRPEPPAVTVWTEGSSGHPSRHEFGHSIWLWPLPDTATVDLWVTWPRLDIPQTSTKLDALAMRMASLRSQAY